MKEEEFLEVETIQSDIEHDTMVEPYSSTATSPPPRHPDLILEDLKDSIIQQCNQSGLTLGVITMVLSETYAAFNDVYVRQVEQLRKQELLQFQETQVHSKV